MDEQRTPDEKHENMQHPHVPGQDPLGSGLPRQSDAWHAKRGGSDGTDDGEGKTTPGDDAPLGGSETTEEQLTADTAVERDTLKSLDPDDSPA